VKIGSAGKIFSLTGWKVGFVCAAPHLMKALSKAHQFLTFTTPPNLQTAVAYGLGREDAFFEEMRAGLQRSRDRLADGLRSIGLPPLDSQGTYFLNVDLAPLGVSIDDEGFCKQLVHERGVALIPVSAFYAENPVTGVVRICFSKRDATLDAALEKLSGLAR
jgi:N-succinyldiaminopimelate aminotransferase